jgi:hypothetical protein
MCIKSYSWFDFHTGLDFAAEGVPWKPIHKIPSPRHHWLADSVNVIAIKVAESDGDYPISVFGIVLARDEYDYRCVYLFKRGRDDPQVITSKVCIQFIPLFTDKSKCHYPCLYNPLWYTLHLKSHFQFSILLWNYFIVVLR